MKPKEFILTAALGCICTSASLGQSSNTHSLRSRISKAQTVVLADVLHSPKVFDGKIVRVVATLSISTESSVLCDESLTGGNEKSFWFELSDNYKRNSNKDAVSKLDQGSPCNTVIVIGRIKASRRVLAPSDKLRPIDGSIGFGHLNAYPFQFTMLSLEAASPCH